MFPLVPIDSQTGEFGDWGLPYHGLFTLIHQDPFAVDEGVITADRSGLDTNNGVFIGEPLYGGLGDLSLSPQGKNRKFMNSPDARLLVVPAHVYARDTIHEDRDLFNGVDFQSSAIINGRYIGGIGNFISPFGWIYIADDGSRWNISLTTGQIHRPNWGAFTLTATPFGIFRYPVSHWNIEDEPDLEFPDTVFRVTQSAGVDDFDSITNGTSFGLRLIDINSNGSKALFGSSIGGARSTQNSLYDTFNPTNLGAVTNQRKAVSNVDGVMEGPAIIYEITLTGTPEVDFAFTVDVFKDQAACAGTVAQNVNDRDGTAYWAASYAGPCGFSPPKVEFTRPDLITACPVGQKGVEPIAISSISILDAPTLEDDARACGWDRFLCDDTSVLGDVTNEYNNFQWWTFTNPDLSTALGNQWAPSHEYTVLTNVAYAGIVFSCNLNHTTSFARQPGAGATWTDVFEVRFNAVFKPLSSAPDWVQSKNYKQFDVVQSGGATYWISKGTFTSYDGDPDKTNQDEPNVGEAFENFWEGGFSILINPEWFVNKVVVKNWIIAQSYTEDAFPANPVLADATWKCIRSHVTAEENKPGTGAKWPTYWEKSFRDLSGAQWIPPIVHTPPDRVNREIATDDTRVYKALIEHTAVDSNKPPNATFWEEVLDTPDCFNPKISGIGAALGQTAYHVVNHFGGDQDQDFHITDIIAGAHYKEDDTIQLYQVDIRYERTKRDKSFTHCWDTGCPIEDPLCEMREDDVDTFTGSITRGPSSITELFTYKFKVAGVEKHTILFSASASAQGSDLWEENFSSLIGISWVPTGSRTLQVSQDGIQTANISETFDISDTATGGASAPDLVLPEKGRWQSNAFVSGHTFEFIDNPYLDRYRAIIEPRMTAQFPGATLTSFIGERVPLGTLSGVDQYGIARPDRDADQIKYANPTPSLVTVYYSNKLIGPFVFGLKTNTGLFQDSQYDKILENDDMNWVQYGVWGPDANIPGKVTLTHTSPTTSFPSWLAAKDYGDDIACAYDPINKVITRNSQYRVVYI